jgi:valyl-tRNA synthetase
MDGFKFYVASEKIYHYFWHTFCDKIIEEQKQYLYGEDKKPAPMNKEKAAAQHLLITLLSESLKLLHPFMPFITEEIYQQLPIKNKKPCMMIENWPSIK